MGVWDRIRHRQEQDVPPPDGAGDDGPGAEWFRPALGRSYRGLDGEDLTFGPTTVVLHRSGRPPLTGEYTGSGRFTTVAPFERPVVFTVADPAAGDPPLADTFVARRTDTADASSAEVRYTAVDSSPAG